LPDEREVANRVAKFSEGASRLPPAAPSCPRRRAPPAARQATTS